MNKQRLGALAVTGAIVFSFSAHAGEQPMSGRYINIPGETKCNKVEGEEGRAICSYMMSSASIGDDGSIRKRYVVGSLDWTNGVGPVQGQSVTTYADGSTITKAWEGESKAEGDKGPVMTGTYRCISATGRFAGADCKGTWASERQKGGFTQGTYKGTITLPD